MHRSRPLLRLASNKAGMNRILKYRLPISEYIRLAVNSGTFYDLEGLIRQRRRQRERIQMSGDGDDDDDDDDEDDEYDNDGSQQRHGMFEKESSGGRGVGRGGGDYDEEEDDEEEEDDDDDDDDDDVDIASIEEEIGLKSILHGTSIMKYPVEYEILSQYPPIPFRPHTPRRFRLRATPNPMRPLMNRYFQHHEQQRKSKSNNGENGGANHYHAGPGITTDDYYYRILHMPPPAPVLQQKSATMVKAYAVVQKQYELMKTEGLSEQDALNEVETMLHEAQSMEQLQTRAVRQHVTTWRQQQQEAAMRKRSNNNQSSSTTSSSSSSSTTSSPPSFLKGVFSQVKDESPQHELTQWKDSAPSLLHDQPDVLYAIATWGKRLQAVPYAKWTVGATTSLDHWIAVKVLQMTEESWQALLEGDARMTSRGRDLIAVRHSLFPETMMASHKRRQEEERQLNPMWDGDDDDEDEDGDDKNNQMKKKEDEPDIRSIEELLATLGGSDFAKEYQKSQQQTKATASGSGSSFGQQDDFAGALTEDKVTQLVDELQEWRGRNVEQPYEEWSKDQKQSFEMWLDRYLKWLAPGESVDRTATRMALLASPPITQEKSKTFWDQLKDETDAQILLDRMLKDGPPPADATTSEYPPQITSVFWELPYEEQLQKLLDLGTLRPILEEYASEKDRVKFWNKYSRIMLEDVELEHLVSDPEGPIEASSLDEATLAEFGIGPTERFRIEKVPWGHDSDTGAAARKKARDLYQAWNWHKASRARYEERLYQLGRLGLQYDHEKNNKDK